MDVVEVNYRAKKKVETERPKIRELEDDEEPSFYLPKTKEELLEDIQCEFYTNAYRNECIKKYNRLTGKQCSLLPCSSPAWWR